MIDRMLVLAIVSLTVVVLGHPDVDARLPFCFGAHVLCLVALLRSRTRRRVIGFLAGCVVVEILGFAGLVDSFPAFVLVTMSAIVPATLGSTRQWTTLPLAWLLATAITLPRYVRLALDPETDPESYGWIIVDSFFRSGTMIAVASWLLGAGAVTLFARFCESPGSGTTGSSMQLTADRRQLNADRRPPTPRPTGLAPRDGR